MNITEFNACFECMCYKPLSEFPKKIYRKHICNNCQEIIHQKQMERQKIVQEHKQMMSRAIDYQKRKKRREALQDRKRKTISLKLRFE